MLLTTPAALVHELTSRGCSSSRHPIALSCRDADKCSRTPEDPICGLRASTSQGGRKQSRAWQQVYHMPA